MSFGADACFRRSLNQGVGVTTVLLRQQGISVFNQYQISEAIDLLNSPDEISTVSIASTKKIPFTNR